MNEEKLHLYMATHTGKKKTFHVKMKSFCTFLFFNNLKCILLHFKRFEQGLNA